MLIQETGDLFIGFTGQIFCADCGNNSVHKCRQLYLKQSILFIPAGTHHYAVTINCPICEHKEIVCRASAFSKAESWNRLYELLDAGKEYTKDWFRKADFKSQQKFLKRLNALKAYEIVMYLDR